MKLLFVINQFYKGGAESSLLNLLKKLDKNKYDVDLLVLNQSPAPNSVSLIPKVPRHVKVCDAFKKERRFRLINKIKRKFMQNDAQREMANLNACKFVRRKTYDWAIHVGEWWNPDFLANEVYATQKAVWIHTDITKAVTFSADKFFSYDGSIDKYIFVSNRSLESCMNDYPFLRQKSVCIYNILDVEDIHKKSDEAMDSSYFERGLPTLVTCANIRKEKNHLRQLKAMAILKERGVDFIWLNIGATSEKDRCDELLSYAEELGLKDRFILAGPRDNPYPYIKAATAVTVLSDYESWSMVITEAKILGTPVIATKTSGALEQILDLETGVLTEFDEEDIADKIEMFLTSASLREKIRNNTKNYDNTDDILKSYDVLFGEKKNENCDLLYVIDDINFGGGAHVATKLQIMELVRSGKAVTVFSSSAPSIKTRNSLLGVKFLSWIDFPENQLYGRKFLDCFFDSRLPWKYKKFRLGLMVESKVKMNPDIFTSCVLPCISDLFSKFKTVVVMSESSVFRPMVAESKAARKVQWIHTDYCDWKDRTEWTRSITAKDGEIYGKYDKIVLLADRIRDKFVALYPHLADKAVVNKNLMPTDSIMAKAVPFVPQGVKFVTVGRVDKYKGIDRIYKALCDLKAEGFSFSWTIVGDGDMMEQYSNMFEKGGLGDRVRFEGAKSNPFPYVKEADVFALLSRYEGIPNTIYEALILGVPVLATDVGGISTQITVGESGWLVDNDDTAIYKGIKHILEHPEEIEKYRSNLKNYHYDNEAVMNVTNRILFD